jgi:hypothetical protein
MLLQPALLRVDRRRLAGYDPSLLGYAGGLWRCRFGNIAGPRNRLDRFVRCATLAAFLATHGAGVRLLVFMTMAEIRGSSVLRMGLRAPGY